MLIEHPLYRDIASSVALRLSNRTIIQSFVLI